MYVSEDARENKLSARPRRTAAAAGPRGSRRDLEGRRRRATSERGSGRVIECLRLCALVALLEHGPGINVWRLHGLGAHHAYQRDALALAQGELLMCLFNGVQLHCGQARRRRAHTSGFPSGAGGIRMAATALDSVPLSAAGVLVFDFLDRDRSGSVIASWPHAERSRVLVRGHQ